MLSSLHIKNFRLFRSLHLPELRRLTLLVGENNSGKSALLEAVQIFMAEASPHLLWDLVTHREETWRGRFEMIGDEEVGTPIRHLFPGHRLPELGTEGIILSSGEPGERLHITTAAYRSQFDEEEGVPRLSRIEATDPEASDPEVDLFLVAENGNRTKRLMRLEDSGERRRVPPYQSRFWDGPQKVQVVPTRSVSTNEIAALWDLIGLTPLEEEVIGGLKLIDESIEAIAFVEDQRRGRGLRIPLVRTSTFVEPVPLNSMGDGVSRLFQIILALVNARGGILLVDEFENGLHWTIQAQVWSTVFRLAERLSVQVFASTHSRDCVEAFQAAWRDHPEHGSFYRLSREKTGDVRPVAYDLETLGDAVASRVEVR